MNGQCKHWVGLTSKRKKEDSRTRTALGGGMGHWLDIDFVLGWACWRLRHKNTLVSQKANSDCTKTSTHTLPVVLPLSSFCACLFWLAPYFRIDIQRAFKTCGGCVHKRLRVPPRPHPGHAGTRTPGHRHAAALHCMPRDSGMAAAAFSLRPWCLPLPSNHLGRGRFWFRCGLCSISGHSLTTRAWPYTLYPHPHPQTTELPSLASFPPETMAVKRNLR